jgi:ribosome-associated protein
MIDITPSIRLDEDELHEEFIRSSGPGGQNVNKVASAVQLRFDVRHSPSLPEDVRERLMQLAKRQITDEGVLVIKAMRFRTQAANREDARERLVELIRRAAYRPATRRATRPTLASRERRLQDKRIQSATKTIRRSSVRGDE